MGCHTSVRRAVIDPPTIFELVIGKFDRSAPRAITAVARRTDQHMGDFFSVIFGHFGAISRLSAI